MNLTASHTIGGGLLREAQAKKKSPKHLVSELFPFIYEATSAMSTREISEWLKKEHKVNLSFVAIAKALRESGRYWEEFAGEVESYAGIVEEAIGLKQAGFLFNEPLFHREVGEFLFQSVVPGDVEQSESDFVQAVTFLNSKWFILSPSTRRECAPYLKQLWEFREIDKEAAFRRTEISSTDLVDESEDAHAEGED